MIVLFVSECEKSAWKRTRRTLSRHAVQIGRRTWMARMSAEGLEDVRRELLGNVSRQMSVACHRVRGRYRTELAWIVGTRRHFSSEGEFAFSHTRLPVIPAMDQKSPELRLLNYLVVLAALFHDTGKLVKSFQTKLRDASINQSDPIRHERISVIFLLAFLEEILPDSIAHKSSIDRKKKSKLQMPRKKARIAATTDSVAPKTGKVYFLKEDGIWINALKNADDLESSLDRIWDRGLDSYSKYLPSANAESKNFPLSPKWHSQVDGSGLPVLLTSLIYLILSHHKMPSGNENYYPLESKYINSPEKIHAGLIFPHDLKPIWKTDKKWISKIKQTVSRMARVLDGEEVDYASKKESWFAAVQFLARPAIVFADQAVSREGVERVENIIRSGSKQYMEKPTVCYANATKQRVMAQTLSAHMLETAKRAGSVFHNILGLQSKMFSPSIAEASQKLIGPIENNSHFYWQESADQLIGKTRNINDNGFFGIVMGETGSGKTRANARILSALSGHANLRFTVALGLRTLTLQTGDEYIDELGFTPNDVGIMVGPALSKFFHDEEEDSQKAFSGTENTELGEEFYEGLKGGYDFDPDCPWPKELEFLDRPKMDRMFKLPIVVCTVDHLTPVVQKGKSSASLLMARVASSDLIIDEIDSYFWRDLVALLKLAFLTGFNGNRFLISSATIPPAIARSLFFAYSRGYEGFCQLNRKKNIINVGWFTHLSGKSQIKKVKSSTSFKRFHTNFIKQCAEKIIAEPVRRKLEILDISKGRKNQNEADVYEAVISSCVELHRRHHVIDPETGIRISIGCVRWNYVRNARALAKFGLNNQFTGFPEVQPLFIAYHSKHLSLIRYEIESALTQILKRKQNLPPFTDHRLIRRHLGKAAKNGKKDVVIIVSTSPISEVGRDFDFDWGILEPCSYWSLIQMCGRIWRHRPDKTACRPNVMLLNRTMKSFDFRGVDNRFFPPWPEETFIRMDYGEEFSADKCFDIDLLNRKIDARPTLLEPEKIGLRRKNDLLLFPDMRTLEHGKLQELLENPARAYSILHFIEGSKPNVLFSTRHAEKNPFRDSRQQSLVWYEFEPRAVWRKLTKNGELKIDGQVHDDSIAFPEQSFFDSKELDKERLYDNWIEKLRREGLDDPKLALAFETNLEDKGPYQYCDILGWIKTD